MTDEKKKYLVGLVFKVNTAPTEFLGVFDCNVEAQNWIYERIKNGWRSEQAEHRIVEVDDFTQATQMQDGEGCQCLDRIIDTARIALHTDNGYITNVDMISRRQFATFEFSTEKKRRNKQIIMYNYCPHCGKKYKNPRSDGFMSKAIGVTIDQAHAEFTRIFGPDAVLEEGDEFYTVFNDGLVIFTNESNEIGIRIIVTSVGHVNDTLGISTKDVFDDVTIDDDPVYHYLVNEDGSICSEERTDSIGR